MWYLVDHHDRFPHVGYATARKSINEKLSRLVTRTISCSKQLWGTLQWSLAVQSSAGPGGSRLALMVHNTLSLLSGRWLKTPKWKIVRSLLRLPAAGSKRHGTATSRPCGNGNRLIRLTATHKKQKPASGTPQHPPGRGRGTSGRRSLAVSDVCHMFVLCSTRRNLQETAGR